MRTRTLSSAQFYTWLDSTIGSTEILPYQLGYDIQRRDRPNDAHGGVLIATKKHRQLGDVECNTCIEFISASITTGKKKVLIAAYYRSPNKTEESFLDTVKNEFSHLKVKARNNMLVIGGDFDLPGIDWRDLCISGTQYSNRLSAAGGQQPGTDGRFSYP